MPNPTYPDYLAMLRTRHQAAQLGMPGMEPWPVDRAARLMAIVQVFGNNEGFTLSNKFNADRQYIQEIYHIEGGAVPDPAFADALRRWVTLYEGVHDSTDPYFKLAAQWIGEMYGFKLLC